MLVVPRKILPEVMQIGLTGKEVESDVLALARASHSEQPETSVDSLGGGSRRFSLSSTISLTDAMAVHDLTHFEDFECESPVRPSMKAMCKDTGFGMLQCKDDPFAQSSSKSGSSFDFKFHIARLIDPTLNGVQTDAWCRASGSE